MRAAGLLILSTLIFSFSGCRKNPDQIPYTPVEISINLNEPAFFDLGVVGGYVKIVGGSRGIIIYRTSLDEFVALDRHSTYNVDSNCQVDVEDDGVILSDECSDSQWLIIDGSVLHGPANAPLERYNTTFTNPLLRIYN